MKHITASLCALALAGCAVQPPAPAAAGRFLHVRMNGFEGIVIQVETPDAASCAQRFKSGLFAGGSGTCSDINAAASLPAVWMADWMGSPGSIEVRFQTVQMCEFFRSEFMRRGLGGTTSCSMSK